MNIIEPFVRDAKRTVLVLDGICRKNGFDNDEEIRKFTTIIHGIKSSLMNIDEVALGRIAERLEAYGHKKETDPILKETPEFLQKIISLIERLEQSRGAAPESGTAQGPESRGETSAQKLVFVIDDDDDCLNAAERALDGLYRVVVLPSAQVMFKALLRLKPDLILLSMDMPGQSGDDAASKLKTGGEYAGIPLVFMTKDNDDKLRARGRELGAAGVVTKPLSDSAFVELAEKTISGCSAL